MSKPFNIHDWQAKQKLAENKSLQISQEEMEELHKNGKVKLKDGAILSFIKKDDVDEANVTGGGASFTTGTGGTGAYATPKAYSKGKKKKAPYRKSGYMGYSEPVKENEENEKEEFGRDVKALEKLIDDKINTKDEWVDMFQVLMAHSEEIRDLNDIQIKILLQQSLKDI